jgi:hypothetical protein
MQSLTYDAEDDLQFTAEIYRYDIYSIIHKYIHNILNLTVGSHIEEHFTTSLMHTTSLVTFACSAW